LSYEPVDALGVWPRQSPDIVEAVLRRPPQSASAPVIVDGGARARLGEALSMKREADGADVRDRHQFATLAEDHELQALTQSERSAALQSFLQAKTSWTC